MISPTWCKRASLRIVLYSIILTFMSGSQRVTYGPYSISSRYPSWRQRASRRSFLYPFAVRDALVRLAACYLRDMFYILQTAIVATSSESSNFLYPSIVTDVHVRLAACYLRNIFYIFENALMAATSESTNFLDPFAVRDALVRLVAYYPTEDVLYVPHRHHGANQRVVGLYGPVHRY
jgi:hypothetical protein